MRYCCTITYIVVCGIVTILGGISCAVPLLVVVDDDSYSNYHVSAVAWKVSKFATTPKETAAHRLASTQAVTKLQCPLFEGSCKVQGAADPSTKDFLASYECDAPLGTSRAMGVIFVLGAGISVLFQACVLGNPQRVRQTKLASSFAGTFGWIAGVATAYSQLNIGNCLRENYFFTTEFMGDEMYMVSAILFIVSVVLHFFCVLGMVSSWWLGCCGDPPATFYASQGYERQQQAAAAAGAFLSTAPLMGQPVSQATSQPVTGYAIGYGASPQYGAAHTGQPYSPAAYAAAGYPQPAAGYLVSSECPQPAPGAYQSYQVQQV